MQMKKLLIVIMILLIPTISISQESQSCDSVLEKCAKVVEDQKNALKKKDDVITKQDSKIDLLDNRNKEVEKELDTHKDLNKISIFMILLLILI